MPVPNTFANATTSIPLSQLDQNFATAITLGNTAIQLGNTVTTLNNMTLANVTVSSGNVTVTSLSGAFNGTVGATTPNTGAFTTLTATKATAGDVATFTNGGASPTALYVNSTSGVSGIFNSASQGGGGIRFSSTNSTVSVGGSDIGTFSATGLAVTGVTSSTYSFEASGAVQANAATKATLSMESASTGRLCVFGADTSTFGTLVFSRAKSNGGTTESARIDTSGNLLVETTSSTAGYALKVGGANANILISADSPNGATLLCDSAAAGAKTATFGQITSVAQAQVRCGGSGGVYLSDGATSWTAISDERQKTDLEPIVNAVEKVTMLRAVTGRYEWDEKRRSFLIAQDVQAVLPEAVDVADDENGTLGLAYTDVIPLLVAAIKELKMEFDAYKAAHP
jgi:Chaperone of endosialidase